MFDRREEFKGIAWQQGRLLETRVVRQYSHQERISASYEERCRAFVYFSSFDEGKSRQLVYAYSTPDECFTAVREHNRSLVDATKANLS